MYWQRSPSAPKSTVKKNNQQNSLSSKEGQMQLTQEIRNQQQRNKEDQDGNNDEDEITFKSDRLKSKIDNLKNKLDKKEGTIEQYQNQINELNDIINEMKEKNNFKTPIRKKNRSVYNAQGKDQTTSSINPLNTLNNTQTNNLARRRGSQSIDQSQKKTIDPKVSIDAASKNGQPVSFQEVVKYKKRILSLEIQNETLEQISELLKHKNETLEKEVKHLKQIIIDPEKKPDVLREIKLRETEDKKYNLEQQMKLMHKQYENAVQQLIEEKGLADREVQILRKQLNQNHEQQPTDHSQQLSDLVKLVDDMKSLIQKKNEQIERLQFKNEILEKNQRQLPDGNINDDEPDEYDMILNPERAGETQKDFIKPILKNSNQKVQNDKEAIDKEIPADLTKEDLRKMLKYKNNEFEQIIIKKNEELEQQEKLTQQKMKIINEAYETIRTYYNEVLQDPTQKDELLKNLQKAQQNENKDITQLCQLLRDLLLRKESQELIAKQEILDQDKRIQQLKDEIKFYEQKNQQELDKQGKDYKQNLEKLYQQEATIENLQRQIQEKDNEIKQKTIALEQQNNDLKYKIKEQMSQIDNLSSLNLDSYQQIKQENYQNSEQNKQLLAVINEKEKEIAHLRLKCSSQEEDLKKLRKRNINLKNQIEGGMQQIPLKTQSSSGYGKDPDLYTKKNISREQSPYMRTPTQSNVVGNQSYRLDTINSTAPIGVNSKSYANTPSNKNGVGTSKNQVLLSNPSIYQVNSPNININNVPPLNANTNPFLKIKYIRTLKEWFQYWVSYADNTTFKFQLLERMSHTEKLKDEFSKSPEMKMRVFKDALESQNSDMYEQAIQIMADIIDLNKLTDKEMEYINNGHIAVRCLRGPRPEEDLNDYHNVHMAGLKVLSFMNTCNLPWTPQMTEEFQNVQAMKLLISYLRQYEKEWPKLLSFNVLNFMAKNKILVNQVINQLIKNFNFQFKFDVQIYKKMIQNDLQQLLIINLDESNQELLASNLNLFGLLLQIEPFKQTVKEDQKLMKLLNLLFEQNNSVLSGTLLWQIQLNSKQLTNQLKYVFIIYNQKSISYLIPQYTFNRLIFKENIIERIAQIGTKSPYPATKSNALTLMKRIVENGDERDINLLNIYGGSDLVYNLELEEEENLKENRYVRERIIKTLKIYEYIIEHSVVRDEMSFIKKLMKLFSNRQIKQEPKVERIVLEIIHQLWDKMEGNMVDYLIEPTVLTQIIDGYIEGESIQDIANYGLMLVGVCERENMNTFILDKKGDQLMEKLFTNIKHTDYKIAYTALKIISFLAQEIKSLLFINENHLEQLVTILKRENLDEEYIAFGLDSIFYLLKQYQSMKMLLNFGIVELLLNIIEESIYQYPVICKAFSCIEMIQTLYQEQNILKKYLIQQSAHGSELLINISQTCLNKASKEIGLNSAFFWKFLATESSDHSFISFIYDRADDFIESIVRVRKVFAQITPEISADCLTILRNLSTRSSHMKEIAQKFDRSD
ncbi:hypothetical protein ABPG73_020896 [Tetrahymena malaccensis]